MCTVNFINKAKKSSNLASFLSRSEDRMDWSRVLRVRLHNTLCWRCQLLRLLGIQGLNVGCTFHKLLVFELPTCGLADARQPLNTLGKRWMSAAQRYLAYGHGLACGLFGIIIPAFVCVILHVCACADVFMRA
jgi:hypothetical protein